MVTVIVGEYYFLHVREIDLQIVRILQDSLRVQTCIDQNAVAISLHERREAPLTYTIALSHKHRGQYGDLERVYLRRRSNVPSRDLTFRELWGSHRKREESYSRGTGAKTNENLHRHSLPVHQARQDDVLWNGDA
jgi:hypothetical protein